METGALVASTKSVIEILEWFWGKSLEILLCLYSLALSFTEASLVYPPFANSLEITTREVLLVFYCVTVLLGFKSCSEFYKLLRQKMAAKNLLKEQEAANIRALKESEKAKIKADEDKRFEYEMKCHRQFELENEERRVLTNKIKELPIEYRFILYYFLSLKKPALKLEIQNTAVAFLESEDIIEGIASPAAYNGVFYKPYKISDKFRLIVELNYKKELNGLIIEPPRSLKDENHKLIESGY